MNRVTFKDKDFELDDAGYLMNPGKWSMEVSEFIAREEGISLGEDHLKVIMEARHFFDEYHCDELPAMACTNAGLEKNCINELFKGSAGLFEKVAGLEMPWAST